MAAPKPRLELISLTLSEELRDAAVGVVTVDPGDMRTGMHQQAYPGEDISDRPLPEVTIPFWLWLFGQEPLAVSGQRYEAQSDRWEVGAENGLTWSLTARQGWRRLHPRRSAAGAGMTCAFW